MTVQEFKALLRVAAEYIKEKQSVLTEIDGKFGDGDHGITMSKVADVIMNGCSSGEQATISELCDDLSMDMFCINGGSASSLWATFFQGFGESGVGEELDGEGLKQLLESGLNGLQEISGAKVGDKTMMDALIPAVERAKETQGGIEQILNAAAEAATEGCEASKNYVSRFGRAKSYGEKTIGFPDAGAVSTLFSSRDYEKGIKH